MAYREPDVAGIVPRDGDVFEVFMTASRFDYHGAIRPSR